MLDEIIIELARTTRELLANINSRIAAKQIGEVFMPTFREARAELAKIGVTLAKKLDGEFRVNLKGHPERTAYYATDLADAVATGHAMHAAATDRAYETAHEQLARKVGTDLKHWPQRED